jgi:CRP/FNR family transcriptional regulator, cyclic AMP receptor protein
VFLDQPHPRRAVRCLQDDGASSSSLSAATLRRLTRIIRSHQQRVVEFSTLPVRSRIHAELLRLARLSPPGPDRTSAVVSPAPTHAEIASRISTHREAVTRELNELARAKLVEKRGGR